MTIKVEQVASEVKVTVNEHEMSVEFSNYDDALQATNLLKATVFTIEKVEQKRIILT